MSRLTTYYTRGAPALAERYEAVSFESVHAPILDHLPAPGAHIADIGAGTGRDARALARMGYQVLAVEPSAAMRAQIADAEPEGLRWCDDHLPALAKLRGKDGAFDFVLCSAVLMHLPPADLPLALARMAALLAPDGRLAVSLRDARPGDPAGLYFDHDFDAVRAAAGRAGLRSIGSGHSGDSLNRADVVWRWFVFEHDRTD